MTSNVNFRLFRGGRLHPLNTVRVIVLFGLIFLGGAFLSLAQTAKVLVVGAAQASYVSDVQAKLVATGMFAQVDIFAANTGTPTLAQLQNYDSVLVFSDASYADPITLGNRLADYVDGGGGVVAATFSFYGNQGLSLQGRIQSAGYLPLTATSQTGGAQTLVADLPGHPLLQGVASFSGGSSSYRNTAALTAGATQVARWTDNLPLVTFKQISTRPVVGLNFYPPSSTARSDFWTASTDGARLMGNSLLFAAAPEVAAPSATTLAATSAAVTGATLNASVNPNGAATTGSFRYGTDPTLAIGTNTVGQALGSGTSAVAMAEVLTGLLPHTTYYFQAIASNSSGTTNGAILNFTTLDRAPDAVDDSNPAPLTAAPFTFSVLANDSDPDGDTLTITAVTNGLRGTVSTNGTTVTYTPGPGYHGNDTFTYTINDGFGMSDTATVTIYQAPDVLTLAATTVIPSAAILNAVANPRDVSTDVGFQYSTDPGLAGAVLTGTVNVGSGSGETPAGIPITGLTPNTRYYYRALAASSAGAATGAIESFLTPVVVWGGAGSNAQTGTLDATIIPGTTSTPIRYVNASNQGYDVVATTSGLGAAGLGSIVGTPGWWFEGRAPNVSGYATTTFRFLDSATNAAVGVTGVRFRLEDAEFTERFANFSYWDAVGNKITVNFNNSIFTYSGTPLFSAGGFAVENGVAYQGGTQMGKWIDIDLSTRAISGFEIQARRQTNSAGSVIMSAWGGGALPMNLWRQLKFGASYTDDTISGDFADPNGDGIINLFAYAFGIEPLGPTSGGLPVTTLTGGYLRITFSRPQSVTDLTYQVEVSSDMSLWLPGSKYSASGDIASNANTTQISRTYVGPNETIVVRDNIPAGSGSRYIRVRVTRP